MFWLGLIKFKNFVEFNNTLKLKCNPGCFIKIIIDKPEAFF